LALDVKLESFAAAAAQHEQHLPSMHPATHVHGIPESQPRWTASPYASYLPEFAGASWLQQTVPNVSLPSSSSWNPPETLFFPSPTSPSMFSLLHPGWSDQLASGLSSQLYQQQLHDTLRSLSPGASIAPLLAPALAMASSDGMDPPKKSPLLEPDNHKFYDHPALLQKLALSKSPVLEAVIYCALNKWGIEMLPFGQDKKLCFKVTDFDKFSVYSAKINSKGKPTTDVSSRVKALRRWFDGIPKVKDRKIPFIMSVKGSEDKHSKVVQLVDKVTAVYQSRLAAAQSPVGVDGNASGE